MQDIRPDHVATYVRWFSNDQSKGTNPKSDWTATATVLNVLEGPMLLQERPETH